jgi:uncharacterized membrane protein YgcG
MEMHLLKVDKIEISSFQTLRLKSRSNFRVSCLRGSAVIHNRGFRAWRPLTHGVLDSDTAGGGAEVDAVCVQPPGIRHGQHRAMPAKWVQYWYSRCLEVTVLVTVLVTEGRGAMRATTGCALVSAPCNSFLPPLPPLFVGSGIPQRGWLSLSQGDARRRRGRGGGGGRGGGRGEGGGGGGGGGVRLDPSRTVVDGYFARFLAHCFPVGHACQGQNIILYYYLL